MLSLDSSIFPKVDPKQVGDRITELSEPTWYAQYGKRIFDVIVALMVCLFVLSWLVPLLGAMIWVTSPGPSLYIQLRTGRNGRVFRCVKFRTMYYRKESAFEQARQGDPRITPLGAFLRRTNLDEMPQFLNVLLGDMSIVGPRPHPIQLDSKYWLEISNYPQRYSVRPGITGLAQVRGARGLTEADIKMRHRVRYDLHYVKRQSLLVDVKLCWLTVKPMLTGSENINAW